MNNFLVGEWELISFKYLWPHDSHVIFPYGIDARGLLIYTKNYYMSVHLMRNDRNSCLTDNYTGLSAEEKLEIAESYGGYCGKYKITGNKILHFPKVSAYPNFINKVEERIFNLNGNTLNLECDSPITHLGVRGRSTLEWRKIENE